MIPVNFCFATLFAELIAIKSACKIRLLTTVLVGLAVVGEEGDFVGLSVVGCREGFAVDGAVVEGVRVGFLVVGNVGVLVGVRVGAAVVGDSVGGVGGVGEVGAPVGFCEGVPVGFLVVGFFVGRRVFGFLVGFLVFATVGELNFAV